MTDEEKAEEYKESKRLHCIPKERYIMEAQESRLTEIKQAFLAGLKAGRPKWHKVADGDLPKGENIHRDVYLKDRYGNLYTGNYFPKDKCHAEDCFAVEFLDWGFQGSQFCKKEQISEWCEISKEE